MSKVNILKSFLAITAASLAVLLLMWASNSIAALPEINFGMPQTIQTEEPTPQAFYGNLITPGQTKTGGEILRTTAPATGGEVLTATISENPLAVAVLLGILFGAMGAVIILMAIGRERVEVRKKK
jgi:hypothetical protein